MMLRVLFASLALAAPAAALPTSDAGVVRFSYPDTTAIDVHLAGDFNGWSQTATPLDREGKAWVTRVFLDPGIYEYAFYVDGAWKLDADNPETAGAGHSVLRVGADGAVLPPRATAAAHGDSTTTTSAASETVGLSLRYLGFVTARRDPALGRTDLDRPLHDVDLRFDAHIAPELTAWFIATLTNGTAGQSGVGPFGTGFDAYPRVDSRTDFTLRYDRGRIEWSPGSSTLRLFDAVATIDFDDPGALVGGIGVYSDHFGFAQRGLEWRQRLLGAKLAFVYADDTEPTPNEPPISFGWTYINPKQHTSAVEPSPSLYASSEGHAGADVLAARVRGGTDALGFGLSARLDRGRHRGQAFDFVSVPSGPDTIVVQGDAFETAERTFAWGVDLRSRWRELRFSTEYLEGRRKAQAASVAAFETRLPLSSQPPVIAAPVESDAGFDLDVSRRVVVQTTWARHGSTISEAVWSARPGIGVNHAPQVIFDYEDHAFTALVPGGAALQRRYGLTASASGRIVGTAARVELEQHWFDYPELDWERQFWFRRQNLWLDQDVVRLERMTLLGARTASVARLHLSRPLLSNPALDSELHLTYAAPGFEHAPRFVEGIVRFQVAVRPRLALRTHTRIAAYRRFESTDPRALALYGQGSHFEAGVPQALPFPAQHDYRTLSATFVELVYDVTSKSDIALGYGVDPFVLYEPTNEYADIGWDAFVFANGASPHDALQHPIDWGRQLEDAESGLERERRFTLEARLRF